VYAAIDLDQFGAQVPAAYGICKLSESFIVACQNAESQKSMVWAVSPPARDCGIECGMPVMLVKNRFPGIAVVTRDRALEALVCQDLQRVLEEFSPDVFVTPNGKCLVDLSRTPAARRLTLDGIGESIKTRIETALVVHNVSVGIARTPLLARILSKQARPSGIRFCAPEYETRALEALECTMLPGVSPACRSALKKYGIRLIGQLARLGKEAIVRRFGPEGEKLYAMATGLYERNKTSTPAVVTMEIVFDTDINDVHELHRNIMYTVDKFCYRIKKQNMCIRQFTMILTYSDKQKAQKTVRLPEETDDFRTIAEASVHTFEMLYQRRVAVKSIVLYAGHTEQPSGQLDLFDSIVEHKQQRLAVGIVEVRNKFRFNSVVSGTHVRMGAV
jgi:DNA polymerase-4